MMQINPMLSKMLSMISSGGNPQQIIQQFMTSNPNAQQAINQYKNMAGDANPRDFAIQLAKQNGMSEQELMQIANKFGLK